MSVERAERAGAVAGALRRDAQAALAGEVDDRDDVGGVGGEGDGGGPLVDREVPGAAREVVRLVARGDDVAREGRREGDRVQRQGLGVQHVGGVAPSEVG